MTTDQDVQTAAAEELVATVAALEDIASAAADQAVSTGPPTGRLRARA